MNTTQIFKALSDTTRLRLVHLLLSQEWSVNDIASVLDIAQPRISRHLKILSDAGMVSSRREGTWIYYSIQRSKHITDFIEAIGYLFDSDDFSRDRESALSFREKKKRQTKEFFDSIAGNWDNLKRALFRDFDIGALISPYLPQCGVSVDLGCGTGELLPLLKTRSLKVIGVDNSPAMLAEARKRFNGDGASIELRLGELEHIPLVNAEADCAVINMVLHHIVAPDRVLMEVNRILEKGKCLLIIDFDSHGDERMRRDFGDHWLGFDRSTVKKLLREARFDLKNVVSLLPDNEHPVSVYIAHKNS